MRVHHVGIWAADAAGAGEFYKGVLGLDIEREYEVPAGLMKAIFGLNRSCKVQVYSDRETRVEVFDAAGEGRRGINHLCLSVGNRRDFLSEAKARGADCLEVRRDDHLIYFIRDPSGVLIEIKD